MEHDSVEDLRRGRSRGGGRNGSGSGGSGGGRQQAKQDLMANLQKLMDGLNTFKGGDDDDSNFRPSTVPGTEHFDVPWSMSAGALPPPGPHPALSGGAAIPSGATPNSDRMEYLIHLLENRPYGAQPNSPNDVILHVFTGVFLLFVLEFASRRGKKSPFY